MLRWMRLRLGLRNLANYQVSERIMGVLVRFHQAQVLEIDSQSLSELTHEELLELIDCLEFPERRSNRSEHDHRKHLTRPELERIVTLLQWLHRKRNIPAPRNALV
jgi:hypothetical protein